MNTTANNRLWLGQPIPPSHFLPILLCFEHQRDKTNRNQSAQHRKGNACRRKRNSQGCIFLFDRCWCCASSQRSSIIKRFHFHCVLTCSCASTTASKNQPTSRPPIDCRFLPPKTFHLLPYLSQANGTRYGCERGSTSCKNRRGVTNGRARREKKDSLNYFSFHFHWKLLIISFTHPPGRPLRFPRAISRVSFTLWNRSGYEILRKRFFNVSERKDERCWAVGRKREEGEKCRFLSKIILNQWRVTFMSFVDCVRFRANLWDDKLLQGASFCYQIG